MSATFPLGRLSVVTGPANSGKSHLLRNQLAPAFQHHGGVDPRHPGGGRARVTWVTDTEQPATALIVALGCSEGIARVFAAAPVAQRRGYTAAWFRLDAPGGRCPHCEGRGIQRFDMEFMEDVAVTCPACQGRRFRTDILEVTVRGRNIGAVLELTLAEAAAQFAHDRNLQARLSAAVRCGLGRLRLGDDTARLEPCQTVCLRLAQELPRLDRRDLLLLDMPAAGEHPDDVAALVGALRGCLAQGATVVVADHQPELLAAADHTVSLAAGRAPEAQPGHT